MSSVTSLLVDYGYLVLFAYVLLAQLGVPLPCGPLLVTAGALSATGRMKLGLAIAVVALAGVSADSIWYYLGRARGAHVLRALCRISLEPEVCVQRTRSSLTRYGAPFLLVAKFVPGLGLMAAPIAGQTRMTVRRFLGFDAFGVLLWSCTYTSLGFLLGEWFERSARMLRTAAQFGALAVVGALVVLVLIRLVRRRRSRARTTRITPVELKGRMDRGEPVFIVDLRPLDAAERASLPGAVSLTPEQALARKDALPKDREVVLFCDCPDEASAAFVAAALQRDGLSRARPLAGGLDAWRLAGYPVAPLGADHQHDEDLAVA